MSKRKRKKIVDPYFSREAEQYANPIPSREFIIDYLTTLDQPATREELIIALELGEEEQQEALRRRLRAMERDGQLMRNRRGGYGLIDKMDLICGTVIGHKDGFGFLKPDDGSDDLFLSAREMRALFDGDRILARVAGIDRRQRREAAVVEILKRNTTHLVGRFFSEAGVTFMVPDKKRVSQEIVIPPGEEGNARDGQIVSVEIISQPTLRSRALARVTEVLGDHLAPGMEIDIAIRSHDLPHEWPAELLAETQRLSEEVPESAKKGRKDIRDLPLVTIDGEDAQDFDDAVYCVARRQGGWTLYVAIADVSSYVAEESALDQEAFRRGTSVYFPGEVIPMLPEILSNGLCSLKPHVDRLCMVCEMTITAKGKITKYLFYPAVMHSHARLTYTAVAAQLDGKNNTLQKQYPDLIAPLQELQKLYHVLHAARVARGAIDFDTVETKVVFGPDRKIEKILPVQRNDAHRLIEECMLAANVAAADYLEKQEIPCLFRVHDGPNPEKLADLRDFLKSLNLGLRGGALPSPKDYAQLLEQIKGRVDAHLIQTVLLRSLSQAVYAPDKTLGHFGLAYKSYTHFTSPIRRYPDLLVHRAIRYILSKKPIDQFRYDWNKMADLGAHCSMTERRADDATRDAMDWLKCEFIQDRVGEEFPGIITSVTGFGLFVELQDIYVEGLVHITALKNDYYRFDASRRRLRGERTGMVYSLGDRLRVKVMRVDLETKKIDFELVLPSAPTMKAKVKSTEKNKPKTKKTKEKKSEKKPQKKTKRRAK